MLEIVTGWFPRPKHPKFRDYAQLLELQGRTVNFFNHRHIVMTDIEGMNFHLGNGRTIYCKVRESLMFAILEAQIAYVEQWSGLHPFILADADCVLNRNLDFVFDGSFDVLLTNRKDAKSPIQNGAMYFDKGCKAIALSFLNSALNLCADHWGGDQEALSMAVEPVPDGSGIYKRHGGRFMFAPCDPYNFTPKTASVASSSAKFITHFKGESKQLAHEYVRNFIMPGRLRRDPRKG